MFQAIQNEEKIIAEDENKLLMPVYQQKCDSPSENTT
jgi:hypothetical protein